MKEMTEFNVKELLEVADCCLDDKDCKESSCPKCPYCSDNYCKETWIDEIHDLLRLFAKKRVTKIQFWPNDLDGREIPTVLVIDTKPDESALTDASLK